MTNARFLVVLAAFVMLPQFGHAAEIKLLASASLKPAYVELLPQFEKATGNTVAVVYSGTPDIQKRVLAGEAADVVILGDDGIQELFKQGRLDPASRANFAKSGIAIAVRAGAPRPAIATADAVKQSLLTAKSVAFSAGASGVYLVGMFHKLGIYDQIKAKQVAVTPDKPVGEAVARGEAEIGLHQISELLPIKGIDIVGPLPTDLQQITLFSGGIESGSANPAAAAALVKFLTAPAVLPVLSRHGLDPG